MTEGYFRWGIENRRVQEEEEALLEEDRAETEDVLQNIDFEARDGELIGVIGSVGSGKTSLLLSLAGESEQTRGKSIKNGSVAYVEQDPFIIQDTIRENILFGHPYNEKRLTNVLAATTLQNDLEVLPRGLDTLIGERGVNLSGGQRARISLARALYADADIYLLDDPLSAVDTRVSKKIF